MAPTMINTDRGTGNIEALTRKVDMAAKIALLEPNATPLTVLTKLATKKIAINPEFGWLEDVLGPTWSAINHSTDYSVAATALIVDNTNYYQAGDLVKNSITGEVVRVLSVGATAIVVTRAFGETTAASMSDSTQLVTIGNVNEEGAAAPGIKSTKKVRVYNYTQIFRKALGLTGTEKASELHGGNDLPYQRKKKGIEHLVDIEHAFLLGERKLDTSGTHNASTTRGLLKWIQTNVTDVSDNTLSETDWDTFVASLFRYGKKKKFFMASSILLSAIDSWARGKLKLVPKDKTYGIEIMQYLTSHGTLLIHNHPLLEEGYAGYGFAIEPDQAKYRFMKGRDTHLRTNIQANNEDKEQDEYLTECGLEFQEEKKAGYIWDVTSWV